MKYLSDWLRCTCILIASACFSLMMKTVKVKRRMSGLHRSNHSQGKISQVMIQLIVRSKIELGCPRKGNL